MKKVLLTFSLMSIAFSNYTYGQEKVGIYTDDPKATLDVNGRVRVTDVPELASTTDGARLYWNTITGKIEEKGKGRPFHIVSYDLVASSERDNLNIVDFDTKIPTDKYSVSVASIYPTSSGVNPQISHVYTTDGEQWAVAFEKYGTEHAPANDHNKHRINPIRKISSWPDSRTNTWHISASYLGAKSKTLITWKAQLLVINKLYSKKTDPFDGRVEGVNGNRNTEGRIENPIKQLK